MEFCGGLCDVCGRPVPAPCPSCRAYHCSVHCRSATNKKKECPTLREMKWLRIVACILCLLIVLTLLGILIVGIIFWDNVFGISTRKSTATTEADDYQAGGEDERSATRHRDAYSYEYYDYKYV